MSSIVEANDPRLTWYGAVSLEHAEGAVRPWRVPFDECRLFPEPLLERAAMPAGVRLAFRSNAESLLGHVDTGEDTVRLDVCCDGKLQDSIPLAARNDFQVTNLPPGDKLLELWLPQAGAFRLRYLELSDGATITPFRDARPRWLTYGSSITQCRTAESPTQTWPAIVARERDLNLTCLGYNGQCHLDPMVALMMKGLPADVISMCVGINVYVNASLGPRAFRPAIIGFVRTLRETHTLTPLAVMSPIFSPPRETTPKTVGFSLESMRQEVRAAVNDLKAAGDANVHYVDGLQVFGAEFAHLLLDELHPDAEGYKIMGRRFLEKVMAQIYP